MRWKYWPTSASLWGLWTSHYPRGWSEFWPETPTVKVHEPACGNWMDSTSIDEHEESLISSGYKALYLRFYTQTYAQQVRTTSSTLATTRSERYFGLLMLILQTWSLESACFSNVRGGIRLTSSLSSSSPRVVTNTSVKLTKNILQTASTLLVSTLRSNTTNTRSIL